MKYAFISEEIKKFKIYISEICKDDMHDNKFAFFEKISCCLEAMEKNGEKYDAIFIDSDLNDLNEMKSIYDIQKKDSNTIVVYIQKNHFLKKSCSNVISFMDYEEFKKNKDRIFKNIEFIRYHSHYLTVMCGTTKEKIKFKDIVSIEKIGRKIYIITTKNKILTNIKSLNHIFEKCNHDAFHYINRSTIINMKMVKKLNKNIVTMINNFDYDISRARIKKIHNMYYKHDFANVNI